MSDGTAETWFELRKVLEDVGGIDEVPMWQLRDIAGWGKLGVNVVINIANQLRDHGLDTLPHGAPLPLDQNRTVRVYVQQSRVGRTIKAVLEPSAEGDLLLREIGTDDAGDVLQQVRRILCAPSGP